MAGTKANKGVKDPPIKAATNKKTKSKVSGGSGPGKKDAVATIRNFLAGMHEMGKEYVEEHLVLHEAGYARTDSTGYRNAMKILLKELAHVEKANKTLRLTEAGQKAANNPNVAGNKNAQRPPPKTNEDVQQRYQQHILQMGKKVPEKALMSIWNKLLDTSRAHTREELMVAAGYKRLDSTGFREVLKWLKTLKLIEEGPSKGTVQFVIEKVFPFGVVVPEKNNTNETKETEEEPNEKEEDDSKEEEDEDEESKDEKRSASSDNMETEDGDNDNENKEMVDMGNNENVEHMGADEDDEDSSSDFEDGMF